MPYCRNVRQLSRFVCLQKFDAFQRNSRYNYKAVKLRIVRFRYGETDA